MFLVRIIASKNEIIFSMAAINKEIKEKKYISRASILGPSHPH
jgi:hypothetical protein